MQVQAVSKSVRISPRKVRLVADAVRSLSVDDALAALSAMNKRGAAALEKTLKSAVANATHNASLERNALRIAGIEIAEGQSLKRYHASTRGRIHPYKRRGSHIRVVLEEVKAAPVATDVKSVSSKKTNDKKSSVEASQSVGKATENKGGEK